MREFRGKGVSGGIAFGTLHVYRGVSHTVADSKTGNIALELDRLKKTLKQADSQLAELYEKALSEVGSKEAEIFDIHRMMLEDEDYLEAILHKIESEGYVAEYAVQSAGEQFSQIFKNTDDPYMQARSSDVADITDRLVRILLGITEDTVGNVFSKPTILAAQDLTPSQTIQMDKSYIKAFITEKGSQNSHTAILARTMNLPAVIGINEIMQEVYDNNEVIVDGDEGLVFLNPDERTKNRYEEKLRNIMEIRFALEKMKGLETVTKTGKGLKLYANVGSLADIDSALENDAGGIGLFRTEFIYLDSNDFPTESEQFDIYSAAAEKMAGKEIVIRTMDIGADKQMPYFPLDEEENPALGFRGIRVCLENAEIFKTQLRAILRASIFGKISIMFPMINSLVEIHEAKAVVSEVKKELQAEGYRYDDTIEVGIMIETPAAAILSGELAAEVDFFSIGTNDLTQYTLALDRQNQKLDRFFDLNHKAVLELIRLTAENAHKHGIWVGICGDLAMDTELTEKFLEIGIDELSVPPPEVLKIRSLVRSIS